jgi:ABC-type Zn uptake system ZnuABC Zn-binding protein ZnuA
MADIVRQVGGERVDVEWLVESGQQLDNIDVTPERRNKLRTADLVLTRGAVEPWMLEGSGNAYRNHRIVRADEMISSRDGDPNQYMWLDPQVGMELTDEIAERLSALEPRSESYFKGNAENLKKQIAGLIEDTTKRLSGRSGSPFLSLDRGFLPIARRFNLSEVKPPSSLSLRDPSPYAVRVLRETAKTSGAGAIFANAETPIALLRDWESRLGLSVLPLDALGSSGGGGRSDYVSLLRYNFDQLVIGVLKTQKPLVTEAPSTTTTATTTTTQSSATPSGTTTTPAWPPTTEPLELPLGPLPRIGAADRKTKRARTNR